MRIPIESLSPEALDRLVEELVTRDGTDYGEQERTVAEKKRSVLRRLWSGELALTFEPSSESCNLIPGDATR